MEKIGMKTIDRVSLVTKNGNLAGYKKTSNTSTMIADKVLNQPGPPISQKTVMLVQKSAPPVGKGNGMLVNMLV